MNEVTIKKVKISGSDNVAVDYEKPIGDEGEVDKVHIERDVPIHVDLASKMRLLRKHLALICEQVPGPKKAKDFTEWWGPELESYETTGFVISGSNETEKVMLIGKRILASGKDLNLNSPAVRWDDEEYPHVSDLQLDIEGVLFEVEQYLFANKRAPAAQMDLPFGEPQAEEVL